MPRDSEYYDRDYFEGPIKGAYRFGYNDGVYAPIAFNLVSAFHPGRALDLGCAKGFLVKHLIGQGVDAWGVDVSEYAVSEAGMSTVLCVDALAGFDFLGGFDLIIARDFMEHFTTTEIPVVLSNIRRCLVPDGHLVVTLMVARDIHDKDESHVGIRPYNEWVDLFLESGLTVRPDISISPIVSGAHNIITVFKDVLK